MSEKTELGIGVAHTQPDPKKDIDQPVDPAEEKTANLKPGKATLDAPEIPGYRMIAEIGEGGMGTVYAAQQDNPQRKVAIKILQSRSQGAFLRFQTEAAAMARLDHPSIARVLEAGESAQRQPFLVMEYVDGTTLDKYVEKLPLTKRLELFLSICDAVQHAHVNGIIHRDLKPSNVMVRDGGRVVVLDFGVARFAHDATPGPTRAGELVGTPLYMSPEQARLRPDDVDARTDVYTLGVILYELACNELPYAAPRGLPLPVLTVLICDEPAVPLSKRDPTLRGDLEAITHKALAKEAKDRYQSVAALADDVRRYLGHLPVSVRMPSMPERARRFVQRRPFVAAAIGAAALAAITFAVVITTLWLEARAARHTAEEARAQAEAARARTEVARNELEVRSNELTLKQARAALARDPTESLAWLATLTDAGVDPRIAWSIVDEAHARGVARDVLRAHTDEVHWVEPLPAAQPTDVGSPTGSASSMGAPSAGSASAAANAGSASAAANAGSANAAANAGSANAAANAGSGSNTGAGKAAAPGSSSTGFVTGGYDGRALLWDASGPRTLFTAASGRVHVTRPSPDGQRIAIGGDSGALHVVSRDGRTVDELKGPIGDVQRVVWSADGAYLGIGDDRGNVWVYPHGSAQGKQLGAAKETIAAIAFANPFTLITGDDDGTLTAWNVDGVAPIKVRVGVAIVDVYADSKRVIAVDAEGRVHVFALSPSGISPLNRIDTGRKCKRAAFGDGGTFVVLGGVGGEVQRVMIEQPGAKQIETIGKHASQVRSIAISELGRFVASGGDDGSLDVHDFLSGRELSLRGHTGRIRHLAFTGMTLLSSDSDGVVRRWELDDIETSVLASGGPPIQRIAVAADRVIAVDASGSLTVWSLLDRAGHPIGHVDGRVTDVWPGADGSIVTGNVEGDLAWWRAATPPTYGAPLYSTPFAVTHRKVQGVLKQVAVTSDRVAVATSLGPIALESPTTSLGTLPGHAGGTDVVAFTPDGTLLASGGQDRAIRIWRREGDHFVAAGALEGPRGDTHFLAFTPKGDRLIVAGNDGAVFQWRIRDGAVDATSRAILAQHTGAVTALAVTDTFVVSAGRDLEVVRAPVTGSTDHATLAAAAITLVIEDNGTVDAVTRTGSTVRWPIGGKPITEIDDGVHDGARIPGKEQWVLAFDDGALVLASLQDAPLADLRATIAKLTTYKLK